MLFDTRLNSGVDPSFRAQVDGFLLGDVALGQCSAPAQWFDRSRRRIERDNLDHIMLQFYVEGSCGQRDGSSDELTRPGDLWVTDLTQLLASGTTAFSNLNIILPRRIIAPLLSQPQSHHMRVLPGQDPLVKLLRSHMQALITTAPEMGEDDAVSVLSPTIALAAAALNGAVDEAAAAPVASAIIGSIRRHIERHLANPALSASAVAQQFGMSERKLYYLFEPLGGFATYVQDRRLKRCYDALIDPDLHRLSIAEIAESMGFLHPKSFSRAFSRKIGMTAREVRAAAGQRDTLPPGRKNSDQWWTWIHHMR
ncbi:helix-turn-helix domain-containing protein [Devosia aquimaris]|uniref:helix-turn-helix domain-containing protein n=1 Tax=Devosia aquimaris TaxID=2866214 RepID=UPI001CD18115|nr:helix-turn-helix domain-containing protein [Devosia sp. CJK-A8-3]